MSSDHLYSAATDIADALRYLREAERCLQRATRNINVVPALPETIVDLALKSEMHTTYQSHRDLIVLLHTRMKEDMATLQEEYPLLSQFSNVVRFLERQGREDSIDGNDR